MEISEFSQKDIEALIETKNKLEERDRRLKEELLLASELQKSLLPRDYPQDMPVEIIHRYIPYMDIGGDFFDYIRLDENRLGIIITDVSGHGIASAFLTALFKGAFNHLAPKCNSAAETMAALNAEFCSIVHTDHYLTAFYIILDTEKMTCEYCNAGHPKQLLITKNDKISELTSGGFFLGMFDGTEYQSSRIKLHQGDTLCLFTDGIIETTGSDEALYDRESIKGALRVTNGQSLELVANYVMTDLLNFMSAPHFDDDITLLLIKLVETI